MTRAGTWKHSDLPQPVGIAASALRPASRVSITAYCPGRNASNPNISDSTRRAAGYSPASSPRLASGTSRRRSAWSVSALHRPASASGLSRAPSSGHRSRTVQPSRATSVVPRFSPRAAAFRAGSAMIWFSHTYSGRCAGNEHHAQSQRSGPAPSQDGRRGTGSPSRGSLRTRSAQGWRRRAGPPGRSGCGSRP